MNVDSIQFDMQAPDDLSALKHALAAHGPAQIQRLALLMRVAGEYTDGSREKARAAVEALLMELGLTDRAVFITVIGAEGASTSGEAASPAAFGAAEGPDPISSSIHVAGFTPGGSGRTRRCEQSHRPGLRRSGSVDTRQRRSSHRRCCQYFEET